MADIVPPHSTIIDQTVEPGASFLADSSHKRIGIEIYPLIKQRVARTCRHERLYLLLALSHVACIVAVVGKHHSP